MMGQLEHYLELLQWGAYAAIAALAVGLLNTVLLTLLLTRQSEDGRGNREVRSELLRQMRYRS